MFKTSAVTTATVDVTCPDGNEFKSSSAISRRALSNVMNGLGS